MLTLLRQFLPDVARQQGVAVLIYTMPRMVKGILELRSVIQS
ncbi:MAG: hypothetical protein QNL17_02680 [Synechococcus sp. ChSW.bin.154]|jgi:hypothetical protein